MHTPRAVVFDMDGTLTDSEITWAEVRRELTLAAGLPYPERATTDMMGMSTTEWSRYCAEVLGLPGTPEEIAAQVIGAVGDAYRHGHIELLPGAADGVRRMARRWPLAVASSSPPELIDAGLDALGVSPLVGVRVSSETAGAGKPDPQVYLEACRLLGVAPTDATAIEDSANGIRAAHAAGMKVVAIPQEPHVPDADVLRLADLVIDSLDELTVALVEALFDD